MLKVWKWIAQWYGRGRLSSAQPHRYVIRRSAFGRVSIRFDGGPSYPGMVSDLKSAFETFGHVVRHCEELSGAEWARRIASTGGFITTDELNAVLTLLPSPVQDRRSDAISQDQNLSPSVSGPDESHLHTPPAVEA